MSEIRRETIETYDHSAEALSEYFQGFGPRTRDIELTFELAGNPQNPKVLEIGCGDGRDAAEITAHTNWYLGFDISQGMVSLAEQNVPGGVFEVADAVEFSYPPDLDVVFAFASVLHLGPEELDTVFSKVGKVLRPGGIFYISTKYSENYREEIKEDQYGRRQFYFYNQDEIGAHAGRNFETVYSELVMHGNTEWLEIALRRRVT